LYGFTQKYATFLYRILGAHFRTDSYIAINLHGI
jgi:hypothetical protein